MAPCSTWSTQVRNAPSWCVAAASVAHLRADCIPPCSPRRDEVCNETCMYYNGDDYKETTAGTRPTNVPLQRSTRSGRHRQWPWVQLVTSLCVIKHVQIRCWSASATASSSLPGCMQCLSDATTGFTRFVARTFVACLVPRPLQQASTTARLQRQCSLLLLLLEPEGMPPATRTSTCSRDADAARHRAALIVIAQHALAGGALFSAADVLAPKTRRGARCCPLWRASAPHHLRLPRRRYVRCIAPAHLWRLETDALVLASRCARAARSLLARSRRPRCKARGVQTRLRARVPKRIAACRIAVCSLV
jgi:hypothetical protein